LFVFKPILNHFVVQIPSINQPGTPNATGRLFAPLKTSKGKSWEHQMAGPSES